MARTNHDRRRAVDRYVDAVADEVASTFGSRVVGVWVVGSYAYGGAAATSDVDMHACVRDANLDEVMTLAGRIAHPTLPCPAAGIEFVLHDEGRLRQADVPLQWLLNLNGGPSREHTCSTDPTTESWHWFVLDLAIGRSTARTVLGEPLAAVVPPFDRDVVVEAIAASQAWHRDHDGGNPNQLANAARGLRFLLTGAWGSKPEGLGWVDRVGIDRDEVVTALDRALEADRR